MVGGLLLLLGLASAEDGEWRVLRQSTVVATSTRVQGPEDLSRIAIHVADEDVRTAWSEGVDGAGIGERLTLPVQPTESVRAVRLQVRNGRQTSLEALHDNGAARTVIVRVLDGDTVQGERRATLMRIGGWQTIDAPVPTSGRLTAVEVELHTTFGGKRNDDAHITDIRVEVQSDAPHRAAIEQARLQRLREQVAMARARTTWSAMASSGTLWRPGAYTCERHPSADEDSLSETILTALDAVRSTRGSGLRAEVGTLEQAPVMPAGLELPTALAFLFGSTGWEWDVAGEEAERADDDRLNRRQLAAYEQWHSLPRLTFHAELPEQVARIWMRRLDLQPWTRGKVSQTDFLVQLTPDGRPSTLTTTSDGKRSASVTQATFVYNASHTRIDEVAIIGALVSNDAPRTTHHTRLDICTPQSRSVEHGVR